jgi:hypothetical protein
MTTALIVWRGEVLLLVIVAFVLGLIIGWRARGATLGGTNDEA